MAQMSMYCKAVLTDELRKFPGWEARVPPSRAAAKEGHETLQVASENSADEVPTDGAPPEASADESYYFVHDDFVVTAGVYRDEAIAFDAVTDEWKRFCVDVLGVRPDEVATNAPRME